MRKIAITSIVVVAIAAGAFIVVLNSGDIYHTKERRQWKNDSIAAIRNDLKDLDYLKKRFGEIPKPVSEFDTSESNWLVSDTIVCRDATWLAYRAQTHKVDPKVYDIFIAKASDGKWYYSDYHFCVGMMVLAWSDQPESLDQFKDEYHLVQFDGSSDDALKSTRNTNGEQVADGSPH